MKVNWLIDSYFEEKQLQTGFPFLADAAREAGFNVAITNVPPNWEKECTIVYGTKSFNLYQQRHNKFCPGSYYRLPHLAYSGFSPYYGKYMLNNDFVLMPFAELVRRGIEKPVFIRPDKTSKAFTGMSVTPENFKEEINALNQTSSVMDDTLCVISSVKPIDSEFRFVIVDYEVVTGSEYRWDNVLDIRSDVLPQAQELAEKIAKEQWQPDRVYVMDICMSDGVAKLLELNPFSSSGLYACDTRKIVDSVSKAAWSEFMADDF